MKAPAPPGRHTIRATIHQLAEGGTAISLHRLPISTITPKQAREFARQINEIANAADQGEVGKYPQEQNLEN